MTGTNSDGAGSVSQADLATAKQHIQRTRSPNLGRVLENGERHRRHHAPTAPGGGADGAGRLRSVSGGSVSRTLHVRFRPWTTLGGLKAEFGCFDETASDMDKIKALLEFVAWGVSEDNQAGAIAGKLNAVLHSHRVNSHMELPTS